MNSQPQIQRLDGKRIGEEVYLIKLTMTGILKQFKQVLYYRHLEADVMKRQLVNVKLFLLRTTRLIQKDGKRQDVLRLTRWIPQQLDI